MSQKLFAQRIYNQDIIGKLSLYLPWTAIYLIFYVLAHTEWFIFCHLYVQLVLLVSVHFELYFSQ